MLIVLGLSLPGRAWSRTVAMQQPCANCHTMHNSQNAATVNGARQDALMKGDCVGCHTKTSGVGFDEGGIIKPFVWHMADPGYNEMAVSTQPTLAGGDFYWVADGTPLRDDLKGHNVAGIAVQVSRTAPGDLAAKVYDIDNPLTCAGVNGCHGDGTGTQVQQQVVSIWGSHHSNAPIDGSSPKASYRMLYGRSNNVLGGVLGAEDPDWEYTLSATDRNQYKGELRSLSDASASAAFISSSCARCHSNFHNDDDTGNTGTADLAFASPWIRHPVDIDIGGRGSEYAYGTGGTAALFQVQTPLGSETFMNPPRATLNLDAQNGEAIITCISCHRAHGSPYDYSLRWNYQAWPVGGYNGCGDCHTTKN
ncbi:MAG: cytochrome c3 family protein [Desulfurivibrionaceae bacterium]|nr:cytochrome c3 family protein [Desulfurivibrionaceae bacterium]